MDEIININNEENKEVVNSLIFSIEYGTPIELSTLSDSFSAIASRYYSLVKEEYNIDKSDCKICIKEIRQCCIEIEFVEFFTAQALPLITNAVTLLKFGEYLKKIFNFFTKKEGLQPSLSNKASTDIKKIAELGTADKDFYLSCNAVTNYGTINNYFILDNKGANNTVDEISKNLEIKLLDEGINQKVLMKLYQTRNDINSKEGNKGTIESISAKPRNIVFQKKENQEEILRIKDLYNMIYIVDVKCEMLNNGKTIIYRILDYYEYFPIEDEEDKNDVDETANIFLQQ